MRWLHISDIHDQPGRDGWSTENLRNGLLEYLKREGICADEIFVTGDYRHAGEQPGEEESVARDAVRFLIEIARQVIPKPKRCEIDDPPEKHIHIVPGNHDLKREKDTRELNRIWVSYNSDENSGKWMLSEDDRRYLTDRFGFFKRVSEILQPDGPVWDEEALRSLHTARYSKRDDICIVYLNTAITCGIDFFKSKDSKKNVQDERSFLIVGVQALGEVLLKTRKDHPDSPIIVLGHHSTSCLSKPEMKAVEDLFADFHISLYLCGDAHVGALRSVCWIPEITMGCIKYGKDVQPSFSTGEIADGQIRYIDAYQWSSNAWAPYPQFNNRLQEMLLHGVPNPPIPFEGGGKEYNPHPENDFYYINAKTKHIGRDDEMKQLMEFCLDDSQPRRFSWWLLCGEGGSGKSRLCLELQKEMAQKVGWRVESPVSHDYEKLKEKSLSQHYRTLYIVDYAERNTGGIMKWLSDFAADSAAGELRYPVRVLLVRRRADSWGKGELDTYFTNISPETDPVISEITKARYREDPLRLVRLEKDDLLEIIKSFAENTGRTLDDGGMTGNADAGGIAEFIYGKLNEIDEKMTRPLYAMILTDAYIEKGKENIRKWEKEEVLDYIFEKEDKDIRLAVAKSGLAAGNDLADLQNTAARIKIMATMLRGLTQADFETILRSDDEILHDLLGERDRKKFGKIKELFEGDWAENPCPPMEPDIVGEYYVLKHLKAHREDQDWIALFDAAWEKDEAEMGFFVQRLHQDHAALYQELLCEMLKLQARGFGEGKKDWIRWDSEKKRTIVEFAGHEWLVLDVRKGKALLLAKDIVECRAYNGEDEYSTWEECELGYYLNGAFCLAYFPKARDRDRIMQTKNNPEREALSFVRTSDKVFLLSREEAIRYFENDAARIMQYRDRACWWWLRSPCIGSQVAANVSCEGYLDPYGSEVRIAEGGVRPAFWLNLKS